MAHQENLLSISSVYLFGRELQDVVLRGGTSGPLGPRQAGANNFLRNQLAEPGATLARIYAFSFEGAFIELARPAIFLVHGDGMAPDNSPPRNAEGDIEYTRLYRSPGASALTGLGSQIGALAEDIRVWIYEKGDLSMRLDAQTGTFEQILLSAEVSADPRGMATGMSRSGGALSRSGGVMSRSGGFIPRRSTDGD
ncbi:conserved hypothetical protein (plasmid) [Rhizobium leguminosarum bv. trifolii WSM2304]|uniref:Uncharacterized protein n=1 Tax=Rhizobium leguminosarum bv. trifolii (strain WSM2304) TaxID=395492 RepID=A0ABF7QUD3_RHILW|nr:hypothetical protein [Rhizobium leguminosarum]ACI57816.1 conserved hypothetical protein [Rhizobium leguminosarum bv. trifolii WSM2304]